MPELRSAHYEEQSAEGIGAALAAKIGAPHIADLRGLDAQTLLDRVTAAGFVPYGTIDRAILPRQLVDTFDRGEQAHVPLLAGFNSGEIRTLRYLLYPLPKDPGSYAADIEARYADLAEAYLRLYPAQADPDEVRLAATRDAVFGWAAEGMVRKQTAVGERAYLYRFNHTYPAETAAGLEGFHASEVPFVFGTFAATPPGWPAIPESTEQREFADTLLDYWTSFARDGRPTAQEAPNWEPYSERHVYMDLGDRPRLAYALMPGMYELHEEVMCRRRASGTQSWNWRTGSIAPRLPDPAATCRPGAEQGLNRPDRGS